MELGFESIFEKFLCFDHFSNLNEFLRATQIFIDTKMHVLEIFIEIGQGQPSIKNMLSDYCSPSLHQDSKYT
jgi:hypothetical protein